VLMPFIAERVFGWKPVTIDASWGLQTIPSGKAYSICNTLHCRSCGLIFLDIRFSEYELGALYHGYRDDDYIALRESYEPGFILRSAELKAGVDFIDKVEGFIAPHLELPINVLDWGGDTGKNTPFKNDLRTFDIYDISDAAPVPGARRVGREALESAAYDLVVSSNVLEHVPYPVDLLLDMKIAMGRNTILYIEVPHEPIVRDGGSEAYKLKRHWHEHINFFTKKSLLSMLEKSGLLLIDMQELPIGSGTPQLHVWQVICKLG
jgi:hypothetical protein